MSPLANKGESTPLSDSILLVAAEHTWPGQVPDGSPHEVAQKLRKELESFPCLAGHTDVIGNLLGKYDTVKTNGDFFTTTNEVFGKIQSIRKVLEKQGILHHARELRDPLVPTVFMPQTLPGSLPIESATRLQKNSVLLMILQYTNRILSLLAQVSHQVEGQIPGNITATALVDAQPIQLSGDMPTQEKKYTNSPNNRETNPEKFLWCGVQFHRRMKMVPLLSRWYLEGKETITRETLKTDYAKIMGQEEVTDTNINQLLRNIRLVFEAENKPLPFQILRGQGIQLIYPTGSEHPPTPLPDTAPSIPEKSFLDEDFDPKMIQNSTPLKIKELSKEAIESLELDETGRNILGFLFDKTEAIHISELSKECGVEIPTVNAHIAHILTILWSQGFLVRIAVENDYIKLINE